MAIIKHKTSRNVRYDDVLEYYSFKHAEDIGTGHYEPILDAYGLMQPRENYAVIYMDSNGDERDPYLWAGSCQKTNYLYGKNKSHSDRKSHEYIISHPESDREKMTMDDLLDEGKAFAREFLDSYDVLIAVHRDTDNDHIHISIGSVRPQARKKQAWMSCDKGGNILGCELAAGGKHQDTPKLRAAMCNWLLEYTRSHGLEAKDNNAIADERKQEWRRGYKNEKMRHALLLSARKSHNIREMADIMKKEYRMELKVSSTGETISVLYPGNEKYVRLRSLGLEKAQLTSRFIESNLEVGSEAYKKESWDIYREACNNAQEAFSAAQKAAFDEINRYRDFMDYLYKENSDDMGKDKKRKMHSRRKLVRSGYFEKMDEYGKVIDMQKEKIDMQRKYQAVVLGRQHILHDLLNAGADEKTIEQARNECHEAMSLLMTYLVDPDADFENRRLKAAQWSLEQARKRTERYISSNNQTAEPSGVPKQKGVAEGKKFDRHL